MYAPAPLQRRLSRSGFVPLGPAFVAAGDMVNQRATTLTACVVATAVSLLNVVLIVLTARG